MQTEQRIMGSIMCIAAHSRRKHPKLSRADRRKCRGFGRTLDLLSQNDGLTQLQIAQALGIRPQSASEAIVTMENQGLVRKEVNPNDRRSRLIFITEAGAQRQQELQDERLHNSLRIFAPLCEEEKAALLTLLEKVTSALQENKEEH